ERAESENVAICLPSLGGRAGFWCLATRSIPSLTLTSIDGAQCFSFYSYKGEEPERNENITRWALEQFRSRYEDKSITKWDIFYYIYAVLHHPEYRTRYAQPQARAAPHPLCA